MEEKSQPHLMAQDAATVDPSKLTALTPEVVSLHVHVHVQCWWLCCYDCRVLRRGLFYRCPFAICDF
jgi:hypothetical protein